MRRGGAAPRPSTIAIAPPRWMMSPWATSIGKPAFTRSSPTEVGSPLPRSSIRIGGAEARPPRVGPGLDVHQRTADDLAIAHLRGIDVDLHRQVEPQVGAGQRLEKLAAEVQRGLALLHRPGRVRRERLHAEERA